MATGGSVTVWYMMSHLIQALYDGEEDEGKENRELHQVYQVLQLLQPPPASKPNQFWV